MLFLASHTELTPLCLPKFCFVVCLLTCQKSKTSKLDFSTTSRPTMQGDS